MSAMTMMMVVMMVAMRVANDRTVTKRGERSACEFFIHLACLLVVETHAWGPVLAAVAGHPASFSSFCVPPMCIVRESPPAACWQACGRSLMMASRFSLAPLGEPGSVMMMVLLRTPAIGRAIIATFRGFRTRS